MMVSQADSGFARGIQTDVTHGREHGVKRTHEKFSINICGGGMAVH